MNDRRENRLQWETGIIKQVLEEAKTGEDIIKTHEWLCAWIHEQLTSQIKIRVSTYLSRVKMMTARLIKSIIATTTKWAGR